MKPSENSHETIEIAPRRTIQRPDFKAPVVIFLHGRGQSPKSVHAVEHAFAAARLLAPTGGVALWLGTTWFENSTIGVARPESVEDAETRFMSWLGRTIGTGCHPWLCGFSNGGAFAGHLMMRRGAHFAGAAILSAPLVLPPWEANALHGKPVFYGWGDRDRVVPRDMFEAAGSYLGEASGSVLTHRIYRCGHEIDAREVQDISAWFSAHCGEARRPGVEPLSERLDP